MPLLCVVFTFSTEIHCRKVWWIQVFILKLTFSNFNKDIHYVTSNLIHICRCLKYDNKLIGWKREVPRRSNIRNSTTDLVLGKLPGDPVLGKLPRDPVLGNYPEIQCWENYPEIRCWEITGILSGWLDLSVVQINQYHSQEPVFPALPALRAGNL